MTQPRTIQPTATTHVNEVRLVGRLSADPAELTLPSGDTLWTFRLVVDAAGRAPAADSSSTPSTARCGAGGRSAVPTWSAGDLVEVRGDPAPFFAAGPAKVSRYQVEVASGRVIRRAAT